MFQSLLSNDVIAQNARLTLLTWQRKLEDDPTNREYAKRVSEWVRIVESNPIVEKVYPTCAIIW
jgi:hypothetical protein